MKNSSFRIVIPSSAPEIENCEVFLPEGPNAFNTGWMVTRFVDNILTTNKVIVSAAINTSNIQVTATLDTTKDRPRIVALLGQVDPLDRKVVEVEKGTSGKELTVYWNNWKIGKIEWDGNELPVFSE